MENILLIKNCIYIFYLFKRKSINSCISEIQKQEKQTSPFRITPISTSKKIKRIYDFFGVSTCLLNSICLSYILKRHGFSPKIKIGVRLDSKKSLKSHSWVLVDNQEIYKTPSSEDFKEIVVFF